MMFYIRLISVTIFTLFSWNYSYASSKIDELSINATTQTEIENACKNPLVTNLDLSGAPQFALHQDKIDWLFDTLSQLPSLRVLNLNDTSILGYFTHINKIAQLQNIEELYFADKAYWGFGSSSDTLKVLHSLPYLRILDMHNTPALMPADLPLLMSLPKLEQLHIADSFRMSGDRGHTWSHFPVGLDGGPYSQILSLDMSGVAIQSLHFAAWTPHLKSLNLSRTDLTKLSFIDLFASDELEELILQRVILRDENIEQMTLGSMSRLGFLDFSYTNVKSLQFHLFSPHLKKLNLAHTNVGNKDLRSISQLKDLEELILDETKISANALKAIVKLSSLKKLSLAGTNIRGAQIELLASLVNLRMLDLSRTNLSLEDFASLSLLTQLKQLNLTGLKNDNITSEHKENLRVHLSNCKIQF